MRHGDSSTPQGELVSRTENFERRRFVPGVRTGNFCNHSGQLLPATSGEMDFNSGKSLPFGGWHNQCSTISRMNVSLYQAAAAMNAQERWQEMITENWRPAPCPASANRKFPSPMSPPCRRLNMNGVTPAQLYDSRRHDFDEFSAGRTPAQRRTPRILRLTAPVFLKCNCPNGEQGLHARRRISAQRQGPACHQAGLSRPGRLRPGAIRSRTTPRRSRSPPRARSRRAAIPRGSCALVEFSNPNQLVATSDGCLSPTSPARRHSRPAARPPCIRDISKRPIHRPIMEMGSLITAMRIFEANQKVLQTQDDRMGKAISDLSGTS